MRALANPEVIRIYDRLSMRVVTTTPEQMAQTIRDDLEKWGPLIKSLNISLE